MSLDDDPPLDQPEHFTDAADAFLRHHGRRYYTTDSVAASLAWLAWRGDVVSAAQHDRVCDDYAARLQHCENAANELVRQLHGEHEC